MGRHGLLGKQSLYVAERIGVPLVIAGPGFPRGERRDALCYLLDIYPTLCDGVLEVPLPPSEIEGKSLLATAQERGGAGPRGSSGSCRIAIVSGRYRTDRWKLIVYNVGGKQTTQLFDLAADPHEVRNLAEDPRSAAILIEMRRLLETHRKDDGEMGADFWKGR